MGLLASAVPTARTAAGWPISRAIHPYGRTSPRRISSVLRSTACEKGVSPRRSNCIRRLPSSWSWILSARSAGGSTRTSARPTSRPNHASNSAADGARIAADTPSRFHATYTGPSTVSKSAYESATPAAASTRSANPAGAFTSPSLFRSIVAVAMVLSSQHFQSAMDVGLDRAHRLSERMRDLCIREVLHVAQHDGLAVADRQTGDPRRQLVDLGATQRVFLRTCRHRGLAAVELDQPRLDAAHAIAHDVDRDPVQPGLRLELAHPLGRVAHERPIGTQERVLGHVFGVVPVAGQREAQREDPVLVLADQALEDTLRTFHRLPKPA